MVSQRKPVLAASVPGTALLCLVGDCAVDRQVVRSIKEEKVLYSSSK